MILTKHALEANSGVLVGGENVRPGSSLEYASCPMYLGIETSVQSFACIHKASLFNFGIVPLKIDEETYEKI